MQSLERKARVAKRAAALRLALGACCLALLASVARADDPIDAVMLRSPEMHTPGVKRIFYDRLTDLWLETLDRPEADLRCQAAQEIAWMHERGMPGLARTVPVLTRELDRPDQHPSVALAAAKTLIALDAKESAPALFKFATTGSVDAREAIEPTLAKWNYAPAREVWLTRLTEPTSNRRALILAIHSLTTVSEAKAVPRLRELVLSAETVPAVRLEAARALGTLRTTGGEADADQLAADTSPRGIVARLAGAWVLRRHGGAEAVRRLQLFTRDTEPAVAAVAVARLVELDPALVEPVLPVVLASPDANVRGYGVEVLFRRPSEPHLRLLGDRLSDAHPDVRSRARRALRDLAAKPELRAPAIREGERALDGKDWRGREQGAVLLAHLDHKPAVDRLLDRLTDTRPEVAIAAAWALRVLAVPGTLPRALAHFQRHTRQLDTADWRDQQLSHLAQMFGEARYQPADASLRVLVPAKAPAGNVTRAAACWALGLIHEGNGPPQLARTFAGRLSAVSPFDMEDETVRRMSAISLGRMKAKAELPTLQKFFSDGKWSFNVVNNACMWSVAQITGDTIAPPGLVEAPQLGWFLTPLP